MRTTSKFLILLSVLFAFILVSCGEKEEPPKNENIGTMKMDPSLKSDEAQGVKTEKAKTDDAAEETANAEEKVPEVKVPSVAGTWTGKFDSRDAVLRITEQKGDAIKGTIVIKYREPINQEVAGKVNGETMMVTMEDKLHSRYMGKYSGKLSADKSELAGTFTMNKDGKNLAFKFVKPLAKATAEGAKKVSNAKTELKKKIGGN